MSTCPSCGAVLQPSPGVPQCSCAYCGVVARFAVADEAPEIATARFDTSTVTGFQLWPADPGEVVEVRPGPPPYLRVEMPARPGTIFNVLRTGGAFDDIDVRLQTRFDSGVSTDACVMVRFRCEPQPDGYRDGYCARLYADGCVGLEWREGREHGGWFRPLTRPKPWDPLALHTLRVLAVGPRIRLYRDGALVDTYHDERSRLGSIYMAVASGDAPLRLALYHLEAREGR